MQRDIGGGSMAEKGNKITSIAASEKFRSGGEKGHRRRSRMMTPGNEKRRKPSVRNKEDSNPRISWVRGGRPAHYRLRRCNHTTWCIAP